mmetsp:Transcript_100969/g.182199  ORF Transcript_100969/g.182199 Transcript_100969/m.182199 type:complete len:130 (-) Transcript_100969:232-621(-)
MPKKGMSAMGRREVTGSGNTSKTQQLATKSVTASMRLASGRSGANCQLTDTKAIRSPRKSPKSCVFPKIPHRHALAALDVLLRRLRELARLIRDLLLLPPPQLGVHGCTPVIVPAEFTGGAGDMTVIDV